MSCDVVCNHLFKMNLEYLAHDEFELECAVRGITETNPLSKLTELSKQLEDEKAHPVLAPNRPLRSDQKNPKRAVNQISVKFRQIYSDIESVLENKPSDIKNLLEKYLSRLFHIHGRLYRLKYSKVVSSSVTELQAKCDQLIEFVQSCNIGSDDLNESVSEFKNLGLEVPGEIQTSDGSSTSDLEASERSETSFSLRKTDFPTLPDINTQAGSSHHRLEKTSMKMSEVVNSKDLASRSVIPPKRRPISRGAKFKAHCPDWFPRLNPNVANLAHESHHGRHSVEPNNYPIYKPQPINPLQRDPRKWPISFDGTTTGTPAKRFIHMVEHQATINGVHLKQIANDLSYFLKGIAADWFWDFVQRHGEVDWVFLKTELIKRFADRRTDLELRRVIDSKKQKPHEKFIDFYSSIMSMSLQMENPLPDSELIFIITQNMRAGLQDRLAVVQFNTIDELVRQCVAYEDAWTRNRISPELMCESRKFVHDVHTLMPTNTLNNYLDPYPNAPVSQPGFYQSTLPISQAVLQNPVYPQYREPNISVSALPYPSSVGTYSNLGHHSNRCDPVSYVNDNARLHQPYPPLINAIATDHNNQTPQLLHSSRMNQGTIVKNCWNCHQMGHFFKDCDHRILRIFCFGCGMPDVIKKNCSHCCVVWGNSKAGVNVPKTLTPGSSQNNQQQKNEYRSILKRY